MIDSSLPLRRLWAAALWLLLCVTWRLWLPDSAALDALGQAANSGPAFPTVPLWRLGLLPAPLRLLLESAAVIALLVSLALVMTVNRVALSPWPFVAIVASLTLLFIGNQHRLQPWAYQAWLYGWLFASCSPYLPSSVRFSSFHAPPPPDPSLQPWWHLGLAAARRQQRWVVILTASIYGYSALGKLDQQFFHTVGPELLTGLLSLFTSEGVATAIASNRWCVAVMPVSELTIAIGLLVPLTRRWAGWGAMAMHTTLLATLGPWALNHSGGVLLWNLFLLLQAWLCFARNPLPSLCPKSGLTLWSVGQGQTAFQTEAAPARSVSEGPTRHRSEEPSPRLRLGLRSSPATFVLIAAVLLPLLERTPSGSVATWWDHWLSWALYSPHNSRAEVQIHHSAVGLLPPAWQAYAQALDDEDDDWCTVDLGRWSLEQRSVPVYPQARFQLGLAIEIGRRLEQTGRGGAIRVKLRSAADRRTGQRTEQWALGSEEVARLARPFWCLPVGGGQ